MRSFSATLALLLCQNSYGAGASGNYGFLQQQAQDVDEAQLLADDVVMDESEDHATAASSSQTAAQRQTRCKRTSIAAIATGLLCAAAAVANGGMNPAKVVGTPKTLLGKFQALRDLQSVTPGQSTWQTGYRAGHQVSRSDVPINLPSWSAAVPGASSPSYTLVTGPSSQIVDAAANPDGTIPGAAPIPSAEPPYGWTWPLKGADSNWDAGLIGSIVEFDMVNFGQIHCGCQTNLYVTKAPGSQQPQVCDAGGNGYGCYELDFMEGNAQAIGTTFHLCGDEHRGDFMCQDDRCLSSKIGSKQGGGKECDSWGCATNTKDLPDKDGKKAYGQGGYIDSNNNFKMSMYFEEGGDGGLEAAWVKLEQDGKDMTYKICDADNYIHAYTDAAKGRWTTQSTYWGGGDGMEWLNGPCWDAPGSCGGNAADHVQNIKLYKAKK